MADWTDEFRTTTVEKPIEPVSAPADPAPAPAGDWTDQFRSQPNPNLALKVGSDIPPDKAAQVLKLQDQTGLPTHVIGPNLEDVQSRQNQTSVGPQFVQDHPKTADLVASDPHWAALLKDDIPGVAYMERQLNYLSNASMRSELELERTYHGLKAVIGGGGPDNSDRIAAIDKQLNTDFKPPEGAGEHARIFGAAAEVAPYAAPLALGAMGGAPAAVGSAVAFGAMETANAYLDYKNKIDQDGNQIPDVTARRWAIASGALTAALSTLGPEASKAANPAIKMLTRGGLGEMLENTGLRTAVEALLKSSIPESMLKTGAFFGGSTWGHIAAGVMADSKDMSPMAILRTIFSPENNKAVLKAAGTGAAVGGVMTAGMGAWKIWADYSKAQEAINTQTAWSNVGNAMKETKAFEMAPEQASKVMDRLAGDGHVYIPMEKWQEWAETQKADPRQAWAQATGNTQAYDEAMKTGSDLQMESKRYASSIASSDHNDFFSKVLRSNPEAMNREEAEAFLGKQTPEKQAARDAEFKIKEAVAPTPETTAMTVPEPLPTPETEPITPAPMTPESIEADQHLQSAREDLGHKPLDLTGMGMSPEQEAGIREAEARAHQAAQDKMVQAITDRQRKFATKEWFDERDQVQSQVSEEVFARPEQSAIATLRTGVTADGSDLPIKLSKADIKADFPEFKDIKLPTGVSIGSQKPSAAEVESYAEELKKRDQINYEYDKEKRSILKEVVGEGIDVSKTPDIANEIKTLELKKGPRGFDQVVDELRERGVIGENQDPIEAIRRLSKAVRPKALENYLDEARHTLEGEKPNIQSVHPDVAASMLGYDSGAHLLHDLANAKDANDLIHAETDRRMQENHPELMDATNMPEAAIQAIHNNSHGELLRAQLKHFYSEEFAAAKGLMGRIAGKIPATAELKADVMRDISVKNWYALQPKQYIQAMRNNQAAAEKALKAGQFQNMVDAKRAELRSFEMYRAAQEARDVIRKRMAKIPRYFKKDFQQMLGKAEGTYREDVNRLLADPAFQNYKQMSYRDLNDHLNAIDTTIHEARQQGKVHALENFTRVDDYRTGLIEQIGKDFNLTENELGYPKPKLTKETPFLPSTQAHLTRMEFYFDHLDKWKPMGLAKQGFSDPMAVARGKEGDLTQKMIFDLPEHSLNSMVEKIPASERALWYYKQHYIPEIGMSLFKPNMIRIARYRQNDYAWNALLEGYGWSDAQGMAVISKLSSAELDLVDGMSKWFEAMKEESFAKYKQFHGIAPDPVPASPHEVTMADGTVRKMEGGYSPVTFTSALSKGGVTVEDVFGDTWGPAKPSESHLKQRTNSDKRPLSLDLNDELRVMGQMIHWVSFADAIADANKFIGDKAIKAHMIAALGEEGFKEVPKWLKDIAGNNPFASSPIDRIYSLAKNASMIANLGLKTTSELKHMLNTTMTMKEIGPRYWAKGIQVFLGTPMKTLERWEQIKEMDPFMRQWAANIDKDISQAAKRLNIAGEHSIFGAETLIGRAMSVKTALTHDFTRMLFSLYGVAYTSIGGSAWEGSYMKAMDGEVEGISAGDEKNAIAYAGRIVRTTIAAGNTEDLPSIMRDKGLARLFTWFYGPMNLLANNVQKDYQKFRGSDKTSHDIAKFASAEFLNIIPAALIGSALANEAPEAKDKLKKWVKWGMGSVASEFAGMVPLLRDVPYAIKSRGHQFNDPFLDVLSSPLWAIMNLIKHAEHNSRFSPSEIKNLGMAAGYFTELPSRQVMDSWAVAHDWMAHRYRPDSAVSGLYHVATGKKPRKE